MGKRLDQVRKKKTKHRPKIPYRCWKCWKRFTDKDPPLNRQCPSCGGFSIFVDKARLKRNQNYPLCLCDGYWFPHRKGSLKCVTGKNPRGLVKTPPEPLEYVPPEDDDLPF